MVSLEFKLLIVNFHYLRDDKPSSGIYPRTPAEFKSQLQQLGKGYTFVSGAQIVQWIERDLFPGGNFCLITFDDGLKEQMHAFEILCELGIPAMFYVPAGPFLYGKVLPVHQLHFVRTMMSDEQLLEELKKEHEITSTLNLEKAKNQYRYDSEVSRALKFLLNFVMNEMQRDSFVKSIFSRYVLNEQLFVKRFYMDENDLKKLAANDFLGSHGTTHRPLAIVPFHEAREDVNTSLELLHNLTGSRIESFSFPYGGNEAVRPELAPIFAGASIRFALTMERGVNRMVDMQKPLFLKRVDTNDAPGGKSPLPELIT